MRAWRFSSASPGSVPANVGSSRSGNASCASSIGTVIVPMPRFAASASASVTLPSLEYRDGMSTPVTRSGPERVGRDRGDERRVDAARQADEHSVKPFLRT